MGKLIKHEFRATARLMVPLYMVALVSGLLSFVLRSDKDLMNSVSSFSTILFAIAIIAIGIMCFAIILSRFYKNVVTDNAYLTMTLPINVHEFIFGELIVAFIWIVLSCLLMAAIGVIFMLVNDMFGMPSIRDLSNAISQIVKIAADNRETVGQVVLFVIEGIVFLIFMFIFYCLKFYFIIAVAQLFDRHRILMCAVVFIAMQFIIPISMYKTLIFFPIDGLTPFTGLVMILIAMTFCTILYLPTAFILSKKLNIQ